jgi:hypothetical protein
MKKLSRIILIATIFGLFFSCEKDYLESGNDITPSAQLKTTIVLSPGESIQDAVESANSGDTIFLSTGVYEECFIVAVKDLTFIGEPPVRISCPGGEDETLVSILGCNVNFYKILFDGNYDEELIFLLLYYSAGGEISKCGFVEAQIGVYATNGSDELINLDINKNVFQDLSMVGIFMGSPFNFEITKNEMGDFTDMCENNQSHIIIGQSGSIGVINSNLLYNETGYPVGLYTTYGIVVTGGYQYEGNQEINIKDNTMSGHLVNGIYVNETHGVHIEQNTLEADGYVGIGLEWVKNLYVKRNTIRDYALCLYTCGIENYKIKQNILDCGVDWEWCDPAMDAMKPPLLEMRKNLQEMFQE